MSEIERHIGKLKKVELNGLTKEEWYQRRCEDCGFVKPDYFDTWQDFYINEVYPLGAVEVNGELWEIIEDKEEDSEDISILKKNPDGTYDYVMQFYNGGTCLGEMLEDALKEREGKR